MIKMKYEYSIFSSRYASFQVCFLKNVNKTIMALRLQNCTLDDGKLIMEEDDRCKARS